MSEWITYVKKYAAANGLSYKDALKEAGPSYRKMKGVNPKSKSKPKSNKKSEGKKSSSNIYCGIKNTPKGKQRGTAEECYNADQVRYYGLEKIDPTKFTKKKKKTVSLEELLIQQKYLDFEAKGLVKKVKSLRSYVELGEPAQKISAQKKIDKLLKRRPALLKEMEQIKKEIDTIKGQQKKINKYDDELAQIEKMNKAARKKYKNANELTLLEKMNMEAKEKYDKNVKKYGGCDDNSDCEDCEYKKYYKLGEELGKAIDNPELLMSGILEGVTNSM